MPGRGASSSSGFWPPFSRTCSCLPYAENVRIGPGVEHLRYVEESCGGRILVRLCAPAPVTRERSVLCDGQHTESVWRARKWEHFADVCACRRDGVCPAGPACPCCCAAACFGHKRLVPSHAHSRIPGHNDAVRGEEAWRALRRAARREQQRVDELERGQ